MNSKRIVALLAIAGGLAALVTSAATAGRRHVEAPAGDGAPIRAVEESGAALAAEVARLHERLRPTTPPQQPTRNLVQFHAPRAVRGVAPQPVEPGAAVTTSPPPAAAPAMKLIGIAEDSGAGGVIRTAIIAGAGELFLVKEGEAVTPRYRVGRISSDAVELTDLDHSTTLRLALK